MSTRYENRPRIVCHMVSAIDGRLITNRWTQAAEDDDANLILSVYDEAAAEIGGDGWLVGRKTMQSVLPQIDARAVPRGEAGDAPPARSRRSHVGRREGRGLAIAVDPKGRLAYSGPAIGDDHAVAILAEQVSDAYLAQLRERGVSYVFAGADGADLHAALAALKADFQVSSLMLQGGGIINGAFLRADLIDEISLLVFPGIDGLSGIPSIFECQDAAPDFLPARGRKLRLLSCEVRRAGVVWLRYAVERRADAGAGRAR